MFSFLKSKPAATNSSRLVLKIGKMHCVSCAANIDLALEDLPGVLKSDTSFHKSLLTLHFDPQKFDKQQVLNTIKELGYTTLEI